MGFGNGFGLRMSRRQVLVFSLEALHMFETSKKTPPGGCIYTCVGIMCSSVANEMPDLIIPTYAARRPPRYQYLLHNHHRKQPLRSNARLLKCLPALFTIRRVDFGSPLPLFYLLSHGRANNITWYFLQHFRLPNLFAASSQIFCV